eukprot:scaffold113072_cov61-Cyclotella_meneghiniana.AAC.1
MRKKQQEHFFAYQPREVLDLQGYIDLICGDGDCVDSDPHTRCTGTSKEKYVFINESTSPDFLNFAMTTAFIPKETEKTG